MGQRFAEDPVTLIIKYCHVNRFVAEHIYALLAEQRHHRLELPEADLDLSDQHLAEFVSRYSAEVEPEIYRSGRWKDGPQI